MTDGDCRAMIDDRLNAPMPKLSGIPGCFYTEDREADIRKLCRELVGEKTS
jgi:hypothetical protein